MHKYIDRAEFIEMINKIKALQYNDDAFKLYGNKYLGSKDGVHYLDETERS